MVLFLSVQKFEPGDVVEFENYPLAVDIIIRIYRKDKNYPMKIEVKVHGCFEAITTVSTTTPVVTTTPSTIGMSLM